MATAKRAASDAVQTTKEIEKKIEKKLTLLWEEIDTWQQDNHYIVSGYRPASSSYISSLFSLSYLHNESVNIYTHLLGSLAFLCASGILYRVLGSRYQTATREDVYAFSCFFLGAVACLGMSATFHTISNHSHTVAKWGNQLDYAGIVLLIWGSFVPVLFYGFRRENAELMRGYWTMVCHLSRSGEAVLIFEVDYYTRRSDPDSFHARQVPHTSTPAL
jgi:adiponectin receptor